MEGQSYMFIVLTVAASLTGAIGQLPLMNSSAGGSAQCETLTLSMCLERDVKYSQTYFPNLAGMFEQADAEEATQSFKQLVTFGCETMADFVCYVFAPPCVEVGGLPVPVPPCREVCEQAREECEPMLSVAGVPWPEQFNCSRFPAMTEPVRCAEPDMRVYSAIEEATSEEGGEGEVEMPQCQEVLIPECQQLGFTHTSFPNLFGHTSLIDMAPLQSLVESQCSADILPLLCGAFLPKCDPMTGDVIKPCKETCRRVSKQCKDAVKTLGFGRVDLFSCRLYPSRKNEGACVEDLRAPAPPMVINTSRPAVSQAQLVLQQPEIQDVSIEGYEIKFFNILGDDESTIIVDVGDVATIDVMTPSRYTMLVRSVNGWGKSRYVDAVVPEYTGYEHCEPLTIGLCEGLKYNMVQYPNLLQQETQDVAGLEGQQFLPLVNTECSPELQPFVCALYAPQCAMSPSPQGIKPPCRELCKSAQTGCEPLMNKFGFQWPDTMDCDMFPSVNDVGRNCFNNDELTVYPTTEGGRGKVEAELGSSVTAYCSSVKPNTRPEWLSPDGTPVSMDPADGAMVYAENLGEKTAVLTVTSLTAGNAGIYNCRLGSEMQPMDINVPKTCVDSESNMCRMEDGSSWMALYPNFAGHATPTEAELASYQFLPLMASSCSAENLPRFVCSLYHPRCVADNVVPPCRELCMAAMTDCFPYISVSHWAWPEHAQCNNFPSVMDVGEGCVPPTDVIPPAEPTPMETTTMKPTTMRMMNTAQKTTTMADKGNMEPELIGGDENPATLMPRSYAVTERGMGQFYRGWVDVQGQGAPNDFCRVVQTDGKPFFSCLLAGSEDDDLMAYTSPNPSVEWFDPGYSNTWYMKDEDSDGRDDYCRCIGMLPSATVTCMKAGPNGFLGIEENFVPESAPQACIFRVADPFFGF